MSKFTDSIDPYPALKEWWSTIPAAMRAEPTRYYALLEYGRFNALGQIIAQEIAIEGMSLRLEYSPDPLYINLELHPAGSLRSWEWWREEERGSTLCADLLLHLLRIKESQ